MSNEPIILETDDEREVWRVALAGAFARPGLSPLECRDWADSAVGDYRKRQPQTAAIESDRYNAALGRVIDQRETAKSEAFAFRRALANIAESGFMSAKHSTPEELVATMDWMVKTAQAALAGEELPEMEGPASAGFGVMLGERVVVHKGTMSEFRGVVVDVDAGRVSVLGDGHAHPRRYAQGSVRPVGEGSE